MIYDKETEQPYTIDFREKAPELSTKDGDEIKMVLLMIKTYHSWLFSNYAPGTVVSLWEVHQNWFITMEWINWRCNNYAENGFEIIFLADILLRYIWIPIFICRNKEIFQYITLISKIKRLFSASLANTLKIIASKEGKDFEGEIVEKISSEIKK